MKLARLSALSIGGCLLGLLALVGATLVSLEHMRQEEQKIVTLLDLGNRLDEFSSTSDALILHGADPSLWDAFRGEGQAIKRELSELAPNHPDARRASRQIDAIITALEHAGVPESSTTGNVETSGREPGGPLALPVRARLIMGQIAGYGVALDTAMDRLVRQLQQEHARHSLWATGGLAGAAMLFALICVLTFLLIHRRLVGPIRSLERTIERQSAGHTGARVPVTGHDELAELATAFNVLADQRGDALAAVEQSERMLTESQRIAQVGSWRVHLSDLTLEWSEQTYRIVGVRPEEFVPTTDAFLAHVHPDDRDRLIEEREIALSGERPHEIEFRIVRPEGEVRHVYERAELEYDASGRPCWLTGAIQDITRQKEAQNEIRRLSERLHTTLDSITEAFFTLDREWCFTYINPEAERLLKRSKEELIGRHVWTEYPEAVDTPIEREYRHAMTEGTTAELEIYYAPLEAWLDIRAYPSEEGLAIFFRDVSERHAMIERLETQERELRASRDELAAVLETRQTLINALPAHIALIAPSGEVLDVNEQWRHFGRANDYADPTFGIGSNYLRICAQASGDCAEEAARVGEGLRAVLRGERDSFALEYPCHAPGERRWFRMMASRLREGAAERDGYNAVVMHVDITERKLAEEELNRLAYEDALTSTPSRNGMVRAIGERVAVTGWQPDAMVVMLDIRQLRDINDAHGYAAGDELLQRVARRLEHHTGEGAVVSRIGGDEFGLFVPQRDGAPAQQQRDTIAAAFARPFPLGELSVEIVASFGYTILGSVERELEDLVREAELALYQARHADRADAWVAYSSRLHEEARERIQITRELRQALADDEFQLHFQPKVDLRTGQPIGSEALLRWMHPDHGLLSPARFMDTAERSQLIGPIGEWVIHEACRCLAKWRAQGLDLLRVAVNVSLVQFTVGDLTELVRDALATHDVTPDSLTLEITESVFEHDPEMLLHQLNTLHEMGVRLALDDFGTGYSSLAYLQKYPFDEIKIDRSFVQGMLDDAHGRNIVNTVLAISKGLGADVVAEGVESSAVRDALLEAGCHYGQGFYYSVPLAEEDFHWLLTKRSALPLSTRRYG